MKEDSIERLPDGRRKYAMDYISDRTLFKAIMFARRMIGRNNQVPSNAIRIAAKYYEVDASKVARYVGQAAGTTRWRKETE